MIVRPAGWHKDKGLLPAASAIAGTHAPALPKHHSGQHTSWGMNDPHWLHAPAYPIHGAQDAACSSNAIPSMCGAWANGGKLQILAILGPVQTLVAQV